MKEVELKLVSELMKNSRRSDRELAKVLHVSQPTATRLRQRMEKEGIIKEYTMIPDFPKLGYEIMAIIFWKLSHTLSPKEREEMYGAAREMGRQHPRTHLLVMNGMGLGHDMVLVSFHKDYSEYADYIRDAREAAGSKMKTYMDLDGIEGFLVNLSDSTHYQPLTLSKIAVHLQTMKSEKGAKKG